MKAVIRLGDATSHDGKAIAAAGSAFVRGIAVARQDYACLCPLNGGSTRRN